MALDLHLDFRLFWTNVHSSKSNYTVLKLRIPEDSRGFRLKVNEMIYLPYRDKTVTKTHVNEDVPIPFWEKKVMLGFFLLYHATMKADKKITLIFDQNL